jgi:NAD-dependent DNA ligase
MAERTSSLDGVLRAFVKDHPEGWNHAAWKSLLAHLAATGISTDDAASIGTRLEELRLEITLESLGVKGLGPKRREAVVSTYGNLWHLRQAQVDELARLPAFNAKVAADLAKALAQLLAS